MGKHMDHPDEVKKSEESTEEEENNEEKDGISPDVKRGLDDLQQKAILK
jgi:hypothetical protein